jgi:hypothetical protein
MAPMRTLFFVVAAPVTAVVLASCALLPFSHSNSQKGDLRMEQIADAVNNQDEAALKALFSARAVEQATDIDERVEYFLSFFPNGGLTWEQVRVSSSVDTVGGKTELLDARYEVSADGKDYWLVFKDFTANHIDPENVGLYALGVAPWSEVSTTGPVEPLFVWAGSIQRDGDGPDGYPGIYVPE